MKTSSMIVGLTAAAFVGAAIFLATRPAAAKAAAEDAFTVSSDCSTITISDMEKANSAAKSIGLIVKPTPDSDALETLKASLRIAIPQCNWDDPPDDRVFVHVTDRMTWGEIERLLEGKTVADVIKMVAGLMQGAPTKQISFGSMLGGFFA